MGIIVRSLVVGFVCVGLGCSSSHHGRYGLTGTVSFRGQPVTNGTIQFVSESQSPLETAGANLERGTYRIPAEHGLPPGRYHVVISAPVRPPGIPADQEYLGLSDELLPASVNTATTLLIEVTAQGPNQFDFPID